MTSTSRKAYSAGTTLIAMVAVIAAMFMVAPAVSAAAPALEVQVTPQPGTFHRGEMSEFIPQDKLKITVTNVGDAPTPESDPLIIANTPASPLISAEGQSPYCHGDNPNPKVLHGAGTVTCEIFELAEVQPGESRSLTLPVLVPENAPDTVSTSVTVTGGGAAPVTVTQTIPVADRPLFDVHNFQSNVIDQSQGEYSVAGGHGWKSVTKFEITRDDSESPLELLKDTDTLLPLGFFGNPAAAPRCPLPAIAEQNCPSGSQVGEMIVGGVSVAKSTSIEGGVPLYNVKPDGGHPAQFAFQYINVIVSLQVTTLPRSEGYGLSVVTPNAGRLNGGPDFTISAVRAIFYGVPFEHTHQGTEAPFLSNPVDCNDPNPQWTQSVDSWEHAGRMFSNGFALTPDLTDPNWKSASFPVAPVEGCNNPELAEMFGEAGVTAQPLQPNSGVQADQPSGLAVDLDFPQANDPTDLDTTFEPGRPQTPEVKDITMKFPAGLSVSPSSADGLAGCSDRAADPAGDQVGYDTIAPVTCPLASRIGTARATTPLVALHDPVTDATVGSQPIEGGVYLIKPHPGDFSKGQDGKFRLLIDLESARYGINIKLPGTAVADKQTGQLTATFEQNPQLPSKHVTVELKSGPRAPLATPATCGHYTTSAAMVPWGSPEIPGVGRSMDFNVDSGPSGSACAQTPGQRPFGPTLSAGMTSSAAGKNSPFALTLNRNDGEQEFDSLNVTMPRGFSAKLAGVPYCSEPAIAAASGRSGADEQASPSCPAASQVGTLSTLAGPGSNPFNAAGKAYLAGPYKGAPLSFAFITPAVAGPFDLGTVVVRAAAYVDPETAQVTVKTDALPQVIDGVPLRIRSIRANIDRSDFTLNPTNCSAMSVNATVTGNSGASASPSTPFQVSGCKKLGFKPSLKISLKGGTKRGDHPALKAVLNYPKGSYANIAGAVVALPHSEFLAQNHIKTICTRAQFTAGAGNGAQCPKGSIYGFATATTPLLEKPVSGPVFLRSSSHKLPDLVAALNGQINIALVGRIDSKNGGIRTTFESVPDAPVSKFVLSMQGGKKGLLENSGNLCRTVNKAEALFTAQNGLTSELHPVLTSTCKKKAGKSKHSAGR